MADDNSNIVSLADVLESKIIKEKELEFYYEKLREIQHKISFLETDLNLTKRIIKLIEGDKVLQVEVTVPLIGVDTEDEE